MRTNYEIHINHDHLAGYGDLNRFTLDRVHSIEATDEDFATYMECHLVTCEQPSIIGHSMHELWIGRKL